MKKNYRYIFSWFIALCLIPLSLFSQHDLTLYNTPLVPQRIYQNPALIPGQRVYVGIPFLSGIRTAYANPFSYNDVLTKAEGDSLNLEVDNVISKISRDNRLQTFEVIDILSAGAKIAAGRYFINFGVRQRSAVQAYIPDELISLLWKGNASPGIYGEHINISPAINAAVYDEWDVTFAGFAMNNNLTYGITAKYLSGRVNVSTKKSEIDFYTDSTTNDIYVTSDVEIRSSNIDNFDEYFNQSFPRLMFGGNNGFAADLGLTYRINDKFSVNASVLDLGFIKWRKNTMTLVSHNPGEEFSYSGLTFHNFSEMFDDLDGFGKKMTDSLSDLIHIDTVYGEQYTTMLPVRYNAGGSFIINERSSVNLLLNGVSFGHHLYPALSVSYSYNIKSILGLIGSYNIFNNQYWNFGGGITVSAGPLQLYVVSDNIPGLIAWKATNNSSIQFGINVALNNRSKVTGSK
jgi:hypothetical protein